MSDPRRTAVIVSAVRTPIGRFLGGLATVPATELGATAIRTALERSGADPGDIEDVVLGNVVSAGLGQAPARQAALGGGVPSTVGAMAVSRVCGSGLQAVMLAAQAIRAGDARVMVAGGMESMSNAPYYLFGHRGGVKFGNQQLVDGLIHDGLWCAFGQCHMGGHAEYTANRAGITREEADRFSLESHRKAIRAQDEGKFEAEIVPVEVKSRRGPQVVGSDEAPRRDTSLEALGKLKPAFTSDMPEDITDPVVTAGNAPGLNDGAAALVALGHPIGASGARILTTLLHAMNDRGAGTGLATLCLGGGDAVALSVERT
jgi:acetyl-CoA C-acetyltransferase